MMRPEIASPPTREQIEDRLLTLSFHLLDAAAEVLKTRQDAAETAEALGDAQLDLRLARARRIAEGVAGSNEAARAAQLDIDTAGHLEGVRLAEIDHARRAGELRNAEDAYQAHRYIVRALTALLDARGRA